jgi:hypothetical protein
MQSAADSTALGVAKEIHLFGNRPAALRSAGMERAEALLAELGIADHQHEIDIQVDTKEATTLVEITMVSKPFLPVNVWGENPIVVSAEAHTYGMQRLCVLSLKDKKKETLKLDGAARVTAPECAVQSNSKHQKGLSGKHASVLVSAYTCTSGGYEGQGGAFVPLPETDCPSIDDPLADREPPAVGGCDFTKVEIKEGSRTLQPGHYCDGLKIKDDAQVTLAPGIYIISGDKLKVEGRASFRGEDVSFYFADEDATFEFKDEGLVELSATTEGPLAGILVFQSRDLKKEKEFKISSNAVHKLIGTIYLPRGVLNASANDEDLLPPPGAHLEIVGAASTYTIIVADTIKLNGVNLVINSDYGASEVPVPLGLGPNSSNVQLWR